MPYCGECFNSCKVVLFDLGFGDYEYWGEACVDTQITPVSECCGALCYGRFVADPVTGSVNLLDRIYTWEKGDEDERKEIER